MAESLPRMARMSSRLPSSRATEINLQSRYPGGILVTKIGMGCFSACRDAAAVKATTPNTVATATSNKAKADSFVILTPRFFQTCHVQIRLVRIKTHCDYVRIVGRNLLDDGIGR